MSQEAWGRVLKVALLSKPQNRQLLKRVASASSFVRTQMLWILSVDLGLHVSEAQQIYLTGTNMVLDTYLTILTRSMSIVNQSCVALRISL